MIDRPYFAKTCVRRMWRIPYRSNMNRLRIISFLLLCLVCGLLSSCLEDIDLDTGERFLNVYCVLKEEPEQELELFYMAPVGGTSVAGRWKKLSIFPIMPNFTYRIMFGGK